MTVLFLLFLRFVYVTEARLELVMQLSWPQTQDPSAPASPVLGLQVCVSTPDQKVSLVSCLIQGTIHKCQRCLLWFNLSVHTPPCPHNGKAAVFQGGQFGDDWILGALSS